MMLAILAHVGIGVGAVCAKACGEKICRHKLQRWACVGCFMLAEATASVLVVDRVLA